MTGLLAAGAAVAGVWALLIGIAVACRRRRVGRARAAAAVLVCYLGLAATAISILGLREQGFAGAAGMLLPCAVALSILVLP